MARLTWHGHSCFSLETDTRHLLLIDPYLSGNPTADITPEEIERLDFILVTHGHGDHLGDTVPLAKRTGATVISTYEIASFLQSRGVRNVHPLHIGGGNRFPFGYAKMTPALHGGKVDGDETGAYTTAPGGFWLQLEGGQRVYHAGDTALLTEMQLLRGRVDVALLPIGDNFTMGPEDAVRAVEFIEPAVVIPMHYNTNAMIRQDPQEFARAVGDRARVEVLVPGGSVEF